MNSTESMDSFGFEMMKLRVFRAAIVRFVGEMGRTKIEEFDLFVSPIDTDGYGENPFFYVYLSDGGDAKAGAVVYSTGIGGLIFVADESDYFDRHPRWQVAARRLYDVLVDAIK